MSSRIEGGKGVSQSYAADGSQLACHCLHAGVAGIDLGGAAQEELRKDSTLALQLCNLQ